MRNKRPLTETSRNRIIFTLLSAVIAAGMTVGAVWAVKHHNLGSPWLHQYFFPVYSGDTVLDVFRNTFISASLFCGISYFVGMFALGQPLGIAMLFYRGFGIGLSAAMVYSACGIDGIKPVLVLILPKAMAFVFVALLSVREILRMSVHILKSLISCDNEISEKKIFRLYCIKFIVLIVISFIISVVDSFVNYMFSGMMTGG